MALRRSGIDESFKGKWLGDVEMRTEEQTIYRTMLRDVLLLGDPWCLVVAGTPGNGKSFLAQVAVNTYNNDGFCGGLYTTQPIIQSELKDGDGGSYGKTFRKYANAPVLVLDEMSDRPVDWTDYVKTFVENVFIERHRRHLATAAIGNISLDRLVAMFEVRVRDRLKEGRVMVMKEKSLRKERTNG